MPRPPIKKTKKLAKAQKEGELQAENEFIAKTFKNKKQFLNWAKGKLDGFLEKIDPLETMAILTTTVFIKFGIEWAEDLLTVPVDSDIFRTIYRMGLGVIGLLIPPSPEALQQKEKLKAIMDSPPMEMFQWGVSFLVAYIIIKHAGELITAGGNILGVAKGLIGMVGTGGAGGITAGIPFGP